MQGVPPHTQRPAPSTTRHSTEPPAVSLHWFESLQPQSPELQLKPPAWPCAVQSLPQAPQFESAAAHSPEHIRSHGPPPAPAAPAAPPALPAPALPLVPPSLEPPLPLLPELPPWELPPVCAALPPLFDTEKRS